MWTREVLKQGPRSPPPSIIPLLSDGCQPTSGTRWLRTASCVISLRIQVKHTPSGGTLEIQSFPDPNDTGQVLPAPLPSETFFILHRSDRAPPPGSLLRSPSPQGSVASVSVPLSLVLSPEPPWPAWVLGP